MNIPVCLYIFIYVFAGSDNVADSTCTIKSSLHTISLPPSNAILEPSNFSLQSFTTDDHSSSLDIIDKVVCVLYISFELSTYEYLYMMISFAHVTCNCIVHSHRV